MKPALIDFTRLLNAANGRPAVRAWLTCSAVIMSPPVWTSDVLERSGSRYRGGAKAAPTDGSASSARAAFHSSAFMCRFGSTKAIRSPRAAS